jgi:DNA-binding response OmpR family regulator
VSKNAKIILVDDNNEMSTFLKMELECEGYQVEVAIDGVQGLTKVRQFEPDLVILDWEMPQMSGVDVCRRLRQNSNVPILMVTAKKELKERVEGLDSGANDYLIKPFELDELLARVRALLRLNKPVQKNEIKFSSLIVNLQTCEVQCAGEVLDLSRKEFDLLYFFMQNPNQLLTKSQIYEKVWGWDADGNEKAVEVYVHSLRNKLEKNGMAHLIHTKRGMGYILKE